MRKSFVLAAAVLAVLGSQAALSDETIGVKRPQLLENEGYKDPGITRVDHLQHAKRPLIVRADHLQHAKRPLIARADHLQHAKRPLVVLADGEAQGSKRPLALLADGTIGVKRPQLV